MAARVCASCWLALPKTKTACPVCGRKTALDPALIEPEDVEWKTRVEELKNAEAAAEEALESEEQRMRHNRTRRLMEAGLPYSVAADLAIRRGWSRGNGGFEVDVAEFEHLVAAGCRPLTAARILG